MFSAQAVFFSAWYQVMFYRDLLSTTQAEAQTSYKMPKNLIGSNALRLILKRGCSHVGNASLLDYTVR